MDLNSVDAKARDEKSMVCNLDNVDINNLDGQSVVCLGALAVEHPGKQKE